MIKGLFATHAIEAMPHVDAGEPVEGGPEGEVTLKRVLTARHLVMLGIGAVIGAGIFAITGTAAAQFAGPALIISFLIAAFACGLAGMCYAEFAAMLPVSGSAYSYSYATLGEVVAWFVGWALVLEYLFAASTVAVAWSGYFSEMLSMLTSATGINFNLPAALASAPLTFSENGHSLIFTGSIINLPAMLIVGAISWLCYVGITQSATVNAIIVAIKVTVIVLFLIVMFNYIHPELWHPFIPPNEGGSKFGWSGIYRGATLVFFAYIGFDAVSTAAGEAKNPQRDMPIGILGSLLICTILYIAMAAVMTGTTPFRMLNTPEPVATAINYVMGTAAGSASSYLLGTLKVLVIFAALAGLSSVVLVMLMGQPRIFYSMSRDGLLPPALGRLHPKHRTPYVGTILVGVIAAVLAGLFPVDVLGDLVSMGTLLAFATVCIGVLVLRRTRPEIPRAFRVPLPWLVCPVGAIACLFLFWQAFEVRWPLMVGWIVIGFLIYGFYGYQHSKLRRSSL